MKRLVQIAFVVLSASIPVFCQGSPSRSDAATPQTAQAGSEPRISFSGFEVVTRANGKDLGFYPDEILGKVRSQWYPEIPRLKSANSLTKGITVVEFVVHKDGSLGNVSSVESSGSDVLDGTARDAITSAAPFKPFPEALRDKELKMRLHFGYAQPMNPDAPVCEGPNLGAHLGEVEVHQVGHGFASPGDLASRSGVFQ
jgi:TonB family protein